MNEKTIEKIQEAADKNKLLFFVGSGLSIKFGLPNWTKMVTDIVEDIGDPDILTFIPVLKAKRLQPIQVLDELINEANQIHTYINKKFIVDEKADISIHKNLIELAGGIITTNYDNAFESACSDLRVSLYDSNFNISQLNQKDKFLFKIHGCAKQDASKCVIFTKDYENLYNKENTAILKLKEFFLNYKIIFIGFGFKDPFVNDLFESIEKISQGNHYSHNIITNEPQDFEKFHFLKPIIIPDNEVIDSFLLSFTNDLIKNRLLQRSSLQESIKISEIDKVKIAFLYPCPIDLDLSELSKLVSLFDGLNVDVRRGFLNFKALQSVDEYDYVIIASRFFKNKLYIEDQNMKSQLVSVDEIFRHIINEKIIKVFITDSEIGVIDGLSFINIASYKNQILRKFSFKTLQNNDIEFVENEIKVHSIEELPKRALKGTPNIQSIFDNKLQNEFSKASNLIVGRVDEQKNIAERILALMDTNKVLNVKGSGGIGKTSLIKKVSYELYQRGHFRDGITFRTCENAKSYDDFEDELVNGFKFQNIVNFKDHLIENGTKLDLLIIIDNFETVVNFNSKQDFEKSLSLLSFASDYASIVITSRENLNVEFEDVFHLTQMTTDDALKLFLKYYRGVVNPSEHRLLRSEILENHLNNNPLAIKLVTKNSPAYGNIDDLKNQLEKHFFETTSNAFSEIYNRDNADINIERTKSIFDSINYSYAKLNLTEKLCFEIIHLFPDGISLNNFKKCFARRKSMSHITDVEIRHLHDKSVIENYDGIVRLQPIIRRFAEYQFFKRSAEEVQKYCNDAYSYNCFILKLLEFTRRKYGISRALKLHDFHKNNLLYVLDYMKDLNISEKTNIPNKTYLLNYVYDIGKFIGNEFQARKFEIKLDALKPFFLDMPDADKLLLTLKLRSVYYNRDFKIYKTLSDIFPPTELSTRSKEENNSVKRYRDIISTVHGMEGYTLGVINYYRQTENYNFNLDPEFFYLGIHDALIDKHGFYEFERDLAIGKLDPENLEKYLESLFIEEHLERLQCTYTLSKVKRIYRDEIKKLVVTNPYTRGLKHLMIAFVENDLIEKKNHFNKAIDLLEHIKYYHIEAIYYYCEHLSEISDISLEKYYSVGLSLSREYRYQYLEFKFINFRSKNSVYKCDLNYYSIDNLNDFIEKYISEWTDYLEVNKHFDD